MISRNLLDVRTLLFRIEGIDETKEETKREVASKKKDVVLKNPHINNKDIEKILIQLVGAVKEVGHLLKCLIVILVFFVIISVAKN